MTTNLKLGAIIILLIVLLDYVWLNLISKAFYLQQFAAIGRLQDGGFKPVIWAVVCVYILLAVGTVFFVLDKVSVSDTLPYTFFCGALFGFVIYGVYDLTNHGILKDYPLPVTLVDWAWGTFLCGVTACVAKYSRDSVL